MSRVKLLDGYTLTHEHMTINLSPGDLGTTQSMGRNPEYVQRLMDATGINIIMSTGYYLEQYIRDYVENVTVSELAQQAVNDLTSGIGSSDICAGVIGEIAWHHEGFGECEQKAWEAMSKAALETNAVVSTHPSRGVQQIPQAEYLIGCGIQPKNIVIGHIEFYPDDEALKSLLEKGVYIGLDMIGKRGRPRDEYRADIVRKVKDWGFLSQLTLSLDICRTEDLRTSGSYGYVYLFETFIPLLKERGITQDNIDMILEENPVRLLA